MARNGDREIIRRTRASDLPGLNQADNPRDAAYIGERAISWTLQSPICGRRRSYRPLDENKE
jgi:hypothetical protein